MAPWQSLAARQEPSLDTSLALTVAPSAISTSLVIDKTHTSGTISGLSTPFITVTATSTPPPISPPTATPTPKASSNNNGLSLPLPAIIGIAVGSFLILAVLLVLFMCLRNRKSKDGARANSRPKRDGSWKRMEEREREKSFGNLNMLTPLRLSLPEVTIPNPFGISPVSPKDAERSEDSHNGPIFLGSAIGVHTTEVKSIGVEERNRHVSISTPVSLGAFANPFIFSNDAPRKGEKLRSLREPEERESATTNYLDLRTDDSARLSANSTPTLRNPSPQPFFTTTSTELRAPPVAVVREERNPFTTSSHISARPSVQALITALDAPPAAEQPPLSASTVSFAAGVSAIGTPRSSYVRASMSHPPGIFIPNGILPTALTDRPATPRTPHGTPLLLRSISREDMNLQRPPMDTFERAPSAGIGLPPRPAPSRSTTPTPGSGARLSMLPPHSGHVGDTDDREFVRESIQSADMPLQSILRPGWSRDSENPSVYSAYSTSSVYSNSSDGQ